MDIEIKETPHYSHVHQYSLDPIQGAPNHFTLIKGNIACSCVMAMQRYMLPVNTSSVVGGGPQVAMQKETCNTFCPKCNLLKNGEDEYIVEITCAGSVNEIPVQLPKKQTAPGKLLSV